MEHEGSDKDIEAAVRTLELLWGARKRSKRGPKRALSVEKIVETAVRIADEEGLEALSMRRVADRLGVGAMSLYTYVPGKAELTALMLDAVLGEAQRSDDSDGEWRAGLELYAREHWRLYHRHTWMLQLPSSRGLLGPNETAMLDAALHALSGLGLSEREMISLLFVVIGYVQGAARTALEGMHADQAAGVSDEQWWSTYGQLMSNYTADADRYPTLAGLSSTAWAFGDADSDFEFGLQRVLDGIETFIQRPHREPASSSQSSPGKHRV